MFTRSTIVAQLDEEITTLLAQLDQLRDDPVKYDAMLERIVRLQKMKSDEKSKSNLPSTDTVLVVSANLLGILWMTAAERETPITSKVLSFLIKPRV